MKNEKQIYFYLLGISTFLYIVGYFFNENSAGGGSYFGDIKLIWNNLQIFLDNPLKDSISHEEYIAGRTPIAHLFHMYLNPFVHNLENFRLSVFFISFLVPILLIIAINLDNNEKYYINSFFVASLLLLSPYFRTSSYWALEENYGLIFLIATYLALSNFFQNKNKTKNKIKYIFFICLLSSLTFYFDQKLIIIPIICYSYILFSSISNFEKIFTTLFYFLLSLPYLFLIKIWGGLMPPAAQNRMMTLEITNIGYMITIFAFYIFPFLITKKINLKEVYSILVSKRNLILMILLITYLISFYFLFDESIKWKSGNGIFYKISLTIFSSLFFQKIFLSIIIFFSSIIILLFFDSTNERIIFSFFIFLSLIVTPVYQEYFDPLVLILLFTFLKQKIFLNLKQSLFIYSYFLIFLIGANIYYYKILGAFY